MHLLSDSNPTGLFPNLGRTQLCPICLLLFILTSAIGTGFWEEGINYIPYTQRKIWRKLQYFFTVSSPKKLSNQLWKEWSLDRDKNKIMQACWPYTAEKQRLRHSNFITELIQSKVWHKQQSCALETPTHTHPWKPDFYSRDSLIQPLLDLTTTLCVSFGFDHLSKWGEEIF